MIAPWLSRVSVVSTVGLALACSSQPGGGNESESSSGSESSGHNGPDTNVGPTTEQPPDSSASGESTATSTADGSTGVDTGVDTEPDAYGGEWCGNARTDRLEIASYESRFAFTGKHDSPYAFVGWVTTESAIEVAVYDVTAASWGNPETLLVGYEYYWANDAPAGTVDAEGNALVGYVHQDPEPHAVIHRYDPGTGAWKAEDLPSALVSPETGGLTTTLAGHAVFAAYDLDQGYTSQAWLWFYDPAEQLWSNPVAVGDPESSKLEWAQDPGSGATAMVLRDGTDQVLALHRDAATGELTTTTLAASGYGEVVAALGDGEFLALVSTGGFMENGEITAHHYADGAWGDPETVGSGVGLGPIRLVTDADGRALASWNDSQYGTFARSFDRADGWADPLTANPTNGSAQPSWADHRVALDDDGFTIAFSTFGDVGDIRTWARRYQDGALAPAVELAPNQPTYSRISALHSLGTDRMRAAWGYTGENNYQGYAYACHTPVSGWSEPVVTPDHILVLEDRPGGEVMVLGLEAAGSAYAEYYAAR